MKKNKRCAPSSFKRQQGVVIIVALFFVALVAAMSYFMMGRLERDTRRTQLLLRNVKAELYAQGSILWAEEQLRTNLKNKKPNQIVDLVPIKSPKDEREDYKIYSIIYDAQAFFNINNLEKPEWQNNFKHLLMLVRPDMSEQKTIEIISAIKDWIMPGQQQNEFNKYYMSLSPPYRAAHRKMASASELQLVKGVTPEIYQALEKYIIALPEITLVNVQTAPAPVIAALSPTMNLETGRAIEKIRAQMPFVSTEVFSALDLIKNHPIESGKILVLSQFFLVETSVEIEGQHIMLYTLMERTGSDDKISIRVVWQSKHMMH